MEGLKGGDVIFVLLNDAPLSRSPVAMENAMGCTLVNSSRSNKG